MNRRFFDNLDWIWQITQTIAFLIVILILVIYIPGLGLNLTGIVVIILCIIVFILIIIWECSLLRLRQNTDVLIPIQSKNARVNFSQNIKSLLSEMWGSVRDFGD